MLKSSAQSCDLVVVFVKDEQTSRHRNHRHQQPTGRDHIFPAYNNYNNSNNIRHNNNG